ncbi:hypothetical protein [Actinacidiphila acididurans]|uniref:Uncharacterized protein n=1 Tax=Actinacidiphila acididurans TaxID=2784346 RepID=A0ABS2U5E4_9ACTN|nr:hypothetical protein [Actinacidiphila acididurans]MBM9510232.1 hypothetical protein [Actinacidiphila acididurans]
MSGAADGRPDPAAWPPAEGVTAAYGPALLDWAAAPGRPRVCLVKGARGSGKSQLLAWYLLGSPSDTRTTVHATVLADGLFADAFAWEAGRQLGYGPVSAERLLDRLAVDPRPLLLLVADLHRAGRGPADRALARPRTLVQDLVLPLLALPGTRALIEVGDSGLLDSWPDAEVVDLGRSPYGQGVPVGPGDDDLTARLVRTSDGRPRWDLAPADAEVVDPGRSPYRPGTEDGPGDDDLPARLVRTSDGRPRWDLAPADAEVVDPGRRPHGQGVPVGPGDDDLPARLVRTPDGRPRWDLASADVREHALDQALARPDRDRAVRALISDPGFLVHGSAVAVAACLADPRIPAPAGLRETWRAAAPRLSGSELGTAERAALLHTAALADSPALARYLLPLAEEGPVTARWARADTPVTALAAVPEGPESEVGPGPLLTADPVGGLTLLAADSGRATGTVPLPNAAALHPSGVAVRPDRALLLLADTGALVPVGESMAYGTPDASAAAFLGRIAAHHSLAALRDPGRRPTALGQSPDGSVVVVGDEQGAVHVWRPDSAAAGPVSHLLHGSAATAVTCLPMPGDGLTLVMSAGMDGAIRLWEPSAAPMPTPVEQRPALVTALAAAHTPYGPVLAAAWNDATVSLWHIATGRTGTLPLLAPAAALALLPDGHLVAGSAEGVCALRLDIDRVLGPNP